MTLTHIYSVMAFLTLGTLALTSMAQTSAEVMCRNKAKEIAAETYQTCVTEAKQGQIEQIRKEYQQRLNDLKNHYDKELKKVSGKTKKVDSVAPVMTEEMNSSDSNLSASDLNPAPQKPTVTSSTAPTIKLRPKKRLSGARELPEKAAIVRTEAIKSENIDMTTANNAIHSTDSIPSSEIVEIPIE